MPFGHFSKDASEYIVTRFRHAPALDQRAVQRGLRRLRIAETRSGSRSTTATGRASRSRYTDTTGYVPTHPQTGKFVYPPRRRRRQVLAQRADAPPLPVTPATPAFTGQGFTVITARRNGIETRFEIFVPRSQDPVEIWNVTLRNTTSRTRRIKAFPYQQWQLTAPTGITDTLTYTRAAYRDDLAAIVARMTNPTSPFMYDAFMTSDFVPDEHECNYDRFMGVYGRLESPAAVAAGASSNSPASGERMCGVLTKTFDLPPGAAASFRILVGVSNGDADVRRLKDKYLSEAGAADALAAVKAFWQTVRGTLTCKTPEPAVDICANSWVKWQNFYTTRHARSSYRGFRDVLQDTMGITPLEPDYTPHLAGRDAAAPEFHRPVPARLEPGQRPRGQPAISRFAVLDSADAVRVSPRDRRDDAA